MLTHGKARTPKLGTGGSVVRKEKGAGNGPEEMGQERLSAEERGGLGQVVKEEDSID